MRCPRRGPLPSCLHWGYHTSMTGTDRSDPWWEVGAELLQMVPPWRFPPRLGLHPRLSDIPAYLDTPPRAPCCLGRVAPRGSGRGEAGGGVEGKAGASPGACAERKAWPMSGGTKPRMEWPGQNFALF